MSSIPPGIDPTDPLASLPPALASIIEEALTEFIKANLPSIYIMIISSLWLGVSLCLFMALLWSSQAEKRRTPLFICCVIAVGFGTIPGILFLRLLIKSFTASISDTAHVLVEIKPYIFALSFFSFFSSFLVDSILLIRLIPLVKLPSAPSISLPSFTKSSSSSRCNFSSSSTIFAQSSTNRFVLFFGPLILIKLGRIAAIIALVINVIKKEQNSTSG
ncbi:hypothetical protein D9758_007559 [Tetrapyrgos nigripes]|uniref:Transmembrane protein n=1 Tax=Tetrapyrgos nigripes TaxID=182062 RepID=A0A8H5G813_9AGAR|nr:hypothetical protein D9758_007559 [Tetrapyrgos nigripes]